MQASQEVPAHQRHQLFFFWGPLRGLLQSRFLNSFIQTRSPNLEMGLCPAEHESDVSLYGTGAMPFSLVSRELSKLFRLSSQTSCSSAGVIRPAHDKWLLQIVSKRPMIPYSSERPGAMTQL